MCGNCNGAEKCGDVLRGRGKRQDEFHRQCDCYIKSLTAKHPKARAKVVEDKANGSTIICFLQKDIPGMIPFNPKESKEDRALSVAPYFKAGNVYFPEFASCKGDLIHDLRSFPNGQYEDTVVAAVQAILYLMDKPRATLGDTDDMLSKDRYWR